MKKSLLILLATIFVFNIHSLSETKLRKWSMYYDSTNEQGIEETFHCHCIGNSKKPLIIYCPKTNMMSLNMRKHLNVEFSAESFIYMVGLWEEGTLEKLKCEDPTEQALKNFILTIKLKKPTSSISHNRAMLKAFTAGVTLSSISPRKSKSHDILWDIVFRNSFWREPITRSDWKK